MHNKELRQPRIDESKDVEQRDQPIPANRVLFIDLDGTLIDGRYQVTSDDIIEAVQSLQDQGWSIGLSSDTPLEPLRVWKDRFGMNGDIIAERGGILEIDGRVIENPQHIQIFGQALERMRRRFELDGYTVWTGDTLEFLRTGKTLGNPGDKIILINEFRKQSIGLYVRHVDELGKLQMSTDLTNMAVDSVRDLFPRIESLNEDLNHDYGILILSDKSLIKRTGTMSVMANKNLIQVGMIGNSLTDFVGHDIAVHYAVANATPEYIAESDFVATQPLTQGVVEILRGFMDKDN